jgi:hypothetical protein
MYYNNKYGHRGTVFEGTYRSRRVPDQNRLYEIIRRIHLYPFSAADGSEKEIAKKDISSAIDFASRYEYSSMIDYLGKSRIEKAIVDFSGAARSRL